MANDSPRCRIFLFFLLLHMCVLVVVVACMCFWGVLLLLHACAFVMWLCIVVCMWCEFLHFLSSLVTQELSLPKCPKYLHTSRDLIE